MGNNVFQAVFQLIRTPAVVPPCPSGQAGLGAKRWLFIVVFKLLALPLNPLNQSLVAVGAMVAIGAE